MFKPFQPNRLFRPVRQAILSRFQGGIPEERGESSVPVYYFCDIGENRMYVSPELCRLFSLPAEEPVPADAWNRALDKLTSRPVEDFPNVYHWDSGADVRYFRLHPPAEPFRPGAIIDVSEEIISSLRLKYRLDYDQLTSLYTRPAFKRKVFDLIQKAPDKVGAMMFADLDNLKRINDSKGHSAGDLHISQMARFFSFFTFFNGVVSRISGDEFAIYLHGFDDQESARRVIHRILAAGRVSGVSCVVPLTDEPPDCDEKLAFSIGLSWYPADSAGIAELMNLADYAMYYAKRNGKGRLVEYADIIGVKDAPGTRGTSALDKILADEAVTFTFQPIYELRTKKLAAYEALLAPDPRYFETSFDLYSAAAEHGRLFGLESMLIQKLAKTYQQHAEVLQSARLLLACLTGEICTNWENVFDPVKDVFHHLIFGVTEWKLGSFDEISAKTAHFRRMGALIAADSFGLGDLSNAFMAGLHLDYLQVDLSLLHNLCGPEDEMMILERLCHDAKVNDSRIIVRNVTSRDELAKLRSLPVDYVQGLVPPLAVPSASPYLPI